MHELALARDIIDIVYQIIPASEISNVNSVVVKIGQFSGVVTDSLKFSYDAITYQTPLEKTQLKIINIPFELKCNACGIITTNEFGMAVCADCGSGNTKVLSGKELEVTEITLNAMEEVT